MLPEYDGKVMSIFFYTNGVDTANSNGLGSLEQCSGGKSCYYWFIFGNASPPDFADKIDAEYDDGVRTTGNIRTYYSSTTKQSGIIFKGPRMLVNP